MVRAAKSDRDDAATETISASSLLVINLLTQFPRLVKM